MIYCFLGSKFNFSYADIWSDMPKCKLILKNRNLKYWFCLSIFVADTNNLRRSFKVTQSTYYIRYIEEFSKRLVI